jgi:hypothetical protein
MMAVIVYLLSLTGVSWWQMRANRKNSNRADKVVYFSMMVTAAGIGTFLILSLPIPNPMAALRSVCEPIGRAILH